MLRHNLYGCLKLSPALPCLSRIFDAPANVRVYAAAVVLTRDLSAMDMGSYPTPDTSRDTPTPCNISTYVDQHSSSQFSNFVKPSPSTSKPFDGTDSGYASFSPTPEKGTLPQTFLKRTPKKLSIFEKDVPDAVRNRFHDLCVLFNEPLYRYLGKHEVIFTAISIKLKYAGESEATAKPWIIVQCDERASKKVRRFFNQQQLKAQYQPRDAQFADVHFGLLVHGRPPEEMATDPEHYICGDMWDEATTLCGKPIKVCTSNATRLATLGGLIKVVRSDVIQLYGMTAGHVIPRTDFDREVGDDEGQAGGKQSTEDESSTVDNTSVAGATEYEPFNEASVTFDQGFDGDEHDGDHDESSEQGEDKEEYELDLGSVRRQQGTNNFDPTALSQRLRRNDLLRSHWPKLGHLALVSYQSASNNDLDWALIQFQDPKTCRPNLLVFPEHTYEFGVSASLIESPPRLTTATRSRDVLILSGMAGLKRGKLATSFGYLMIGPVKQFNEIYHVSMSEGSVLDAGDCGSWVVDSVTHEVYGHVVASDSFGDAYVIPLDHTFRDIKQQLAADKVCLPTESEVLEWIQPHNIQSCQNGSTMSFCEDGTVDTFTWNPSLHMTPPRTGLFAIETPEDNSGLPPRFEHRKGLVGSFTDSGYSSTRSTPQNRPRNHFPDGSSDILSTPPAKGITPPE